MSVLQAIITAARNLRAEMKLDQKQQVEGALFSRSMALEVARASQDVIVKLANVKLEVVEGAAPQTDSTGVSTNDFDLVLRAPAAEVEARRQKLAKEKAQLEKVRDSSARQLENQEFLNKAPAAVIESIRQKLVQYDTQIAKLGQTLERM
ncbi:MAG: hypothetical protein HY238_15450 [Acidobacteria bacterium]|nr:hypothetical protein [Acidobacteriota bacterium]